MSLPADATQQPFELPSGQLVPVWRWAPRFARWQGEVLGEPFKKTYTIKPPIDVMGERYFAELAICRALADYGWRAVWLDAFHGRIWSGMIDVEPSTNIPPDVRAKYAPLLSGKGVWDVFAWKPGKALFAESKGPGDKIRDTQLKWLDVASKCGLALEFLIVEWSFESPDP